MSEAVAPPEPAPPPKRDPEAFALRGRPPRAIRFRRRLIIAIAAIGAIALMLVAWLALRPHLFHVVRAQDEQAQPDAHQASEVLAGLPGSYGDTPKLGPPLPGDLGKPILERQQQLAVETPDGSAERAVQAAEAERQRQLAELKAARESGLLVQSGSRGTALGEGTPAQPVTAVTEGVSDPAASATDTGRIALDRDHDLGSQQHKTDFVRALDTQGDVNPHALQPATSPYMLSAGSVIAASLITGLDSDLPGLVTAQVTENVYDSATGRILLIPQGARLVGSYDSVVAFGQRRALVVWQRIILPDGSSLRLDNVPATDAAGYAGLEDKVDFHSWQLLKGVVLSTLLGVGAELQFSGQGDLVEAIRQSTQQSISRAGDQLTSRSLDIQPTIRIRPGTPVRLVVHKDLILAPWRR
ncbi:TrbI/VirB10 family protein [Flavisphingomonas formosensis]|uniref:TrbI/VirB10 family protein n=1 Tax=Flavisphingomonas formosensis TaxID=861534 RepID=UPI0012F91718|nr:TrbI/VirB10 family protein [Sphingomonas formosensis]